ncbi:MAG: amidase [Chloroflexi bacterium]|nr:amidase [Chloroflexota bacterium]
MSELCWLSAVEMARLTAAGEISATEVTRSFLERIDRYDAQLRAYITVDAAGALAQAQAADSASGPRGPLHGVPVAVKDNIATAGLRTTAGSRVLANWIPTSDAPVVRRLKEAGAVILGKTNMHEFAYGGTCTNVEFGAVRNPWNTDHVPGGSSGGSGVALAAGLSTLALGTDTAGSVRLPAAQCGVVGLKPTYGLVSIQDVVPLAWSLDHVGPMARSVADVALLLGVLAGWESTDPTSRRSPATGAGASRDAGLAGIRLGVPRHYFFDALQPDVEAAVNQALGVLRDLGAELVDVQWPDVDLSNSITWTIILAEASAYHRQWFRTQPDNYSADTRADLTLGESVLAADYVQAQRARTRLQHQVREVLAGVHALVSPALAMTPPRIGQTTVIVGGKQKQINPVFIRLADPFNVTGLPAISLPCGFGTDGLPIGLQVAAAAFAEPMVLRIALAYERATDWHTRRPPR